MTTTRPSGYSEILDPTDEQIADLMARKDSGELARVIVDRTTRGRVRAVWFRKAVRRVVHPVPGNSDPAVSRVPRPLIVPSVFSPFPSTEAKRKGPGYIPWAIPDHSGPAPTSPKPGGKARSENPLRPNWPEPGKPMPSSLPPHKPSGPSLSTTLTWAFLAFFWTVIVGVACKLV